MSPRPPRDHTGDQRVASRVLPSQTLTKLSRLTMSFKEVKYGVLKGSL